jgi:DNA-binding transcriptional ArsR family regulator
VKRAIKMLPENRLIEEETTIRRLYLPTEVKLTRDSLIRWLALSMGLIKPGESRVSVVKILDVLITYHREKRILTPDEITSLSESWGVDEKTIYYHLNRMKKLGLVTKLPKGYMLGKFFEERLSNFLVSYYKERFDRFLERFKEGVKALESLDV